MGRVALLILFNHNYESSLDRLDKIYAPRFDNIYYIMPFYQGSRNDVITVYENSFYFQGYIAKALEQLKNNGFEHYIVIGDDLYLRPEINQLNYKAYFKVDDDTAFIPGIFLLNDIKDKRPDRPMAPYWSGVIHGLKFKTRQQGIEIARFLPDYEEALALLKRHGFDFTPELKSNFFYKSLKMFPRSKEEYLRKKPVVIDYIKNLTFLYKKKMFSYPLVGSYSDIVVIPASGVDAMIRYCGIFAALNLFVEIALPTALAMSVKKIVSEKNLGLGGITLWNPKDVSSFENTYQNSISNLTTHFPEQSLYVHPIKLSRWTL